MSCQHMCQHESKLTKQLFIYCPVLRISAQIFKPSLRKRQNFFHGSEAETLYQRKTILVFQLL